MSKEDTEEKESSGDAKRSPGDTHLRMSVDQKEIAKLLKLLWNIDYNAVFWDGIKRWASFRPIEKETTLNQGMREAILERLDGIYDWDPVQVLLEDLDVFTHFLTVREAITSKQLEELIEKAKAMLNVLERMRSGRKK